MSILIKNQDMPPEGEKYILEIRHDGTVYDAIGQRVAAHAVQADSPWRRVEDELPKLPDNDYCHVWCVGWFEGQKRSVPMEYGRILKRGKRVERWLLYDRICLPPTKWAYLPEPPKEDA